MANPTNVIPTPHYFEALAAGVRLARGAGICIDASGDGDPKIAMAARRICEGLEERFPDLQGRIRGAGPCAEGEIAIRLVHFPRNRDFDAKLNLLDRQVLAGANCEQAYVLRTFSEKEVLIAGAPQGVLYGAMTLLQLLDSPSASGERAIPGAYIRDFPAFELRTAGWLLNGEANRWSYDRGRGAEAYERLCERKLELCLKYKINAVMFDGFGFGLKERRADYPGMMRRLNRYARERGIRLIHGLYGAGFGMEYQMGPLYEDARYLGTVFRNRVAYPDGALYSCLGYPEHRVKAGVDAGTMGTCRSNDAMNALKAEELRDYMRAVQPGGVYIHNEDYGGFDTLQKYWLKRCPKCRARWPNDDAAAADGAAGGVANGFKYLIEAVNSVRDSETGYEAARDCSIYLTSPLYTPSSPSTEDWSKAITHWQNVALGLPRTENTCVVFREVFRQPHGSVRWVDCFNRAMQDAGARLPVFMYFLCGGDNWCNDNPFVATPCLDYVFRGAQGIYNANGSAYQEPQQVLNAECAWNADAGRDLLGALQAKDEQELWSALLTTDVLPDGVFGAGGFLERACASLYGERACGAMTKVFSEWLALPDTGRAGGGEGVDAVDKVMEPGRPGAEYLPLAFNKVFGIPVHWRRLALDSKSWPRDLANQRYRKHFEDIGISRTELHRRLKRFWRRVGEASQNALGHLRQAREASPRDSCREDLAFLEEATGISVSLSGALADFHEAKRLLHRDPPDPAAALKALSCCESCVAALQKRVRDAYLEVTDPSGAEVGALLLYMERFEGAIQDAMRLSKASSPAPSHA
ncbi:MAG: glycoside hydrolase family 20 zincin-like fold domain-containing protein [Planctomycetes bacterium]|nr:glycoside hydrolase family 20 zincin-like fold domain-containing protein [Planctomycetota bacterium]